jgi:hypothetical protein
MGGPGGSKGGSSRVGGAARRRPASGRNSFPINECRARDSNPDGLPQWFLRPPRLPFRQLGAAASYASHGSLTGVATVIRLIALGVLFLPGPDVWRYLGGILFVVAAAVLIIGMDRR